MTAVSVGGGGGSILSTMLRMRRTRPLLLALCIIFTVYYLGWTRQIEGIAVQKVQDVKTYGAQAGLWPASPQTPQSNSNVPPPAPPPQDAKQPPLTDKDSAALEAVKLQQSAFDAAQKDVKPPSNPNSAARPDPVYSPSDTAQEELDGFRMHGEGRKLPPPPIDGTAVIQQWSPQPEHFPVKSAEIIALPTGSPIKLPTIQFAFSSESSTAKTTRLQRQEHVKKEFEHAWAGYRKHAWMHDELKPSTNLSEDPFMGWAATLVDSLDTLWIMDMKKEFEDAVNAVAEINFHTSARSHIPLFETTIRYLGGLLGAYDVSGGKYQILLDQAVKLGDILLDAFDTPNRMPVLYHPWMKTFRENPQRAAARSNLAELGSLSMEFTRLAQLTKQNKYYDAVARVTNALAAWQQNTKIPGLWPFEVDASGCKKPDPPRPSFSEEEEVLGVAALNAAMEATAKIAEPEKITRRQITPNKPELIKSDGQRPPRPNEVDCEPNGLASPPGNFQEGFGMGGSADSTYEYLLKNYLLLGGREPQYKSMYELAASAAVEKLLFRPMTPDNADIRALGGVHSLYGDDGKLENRFHARIEHLGCFAGGMFAMGAKLFQRTSDLDIGNKLTEGCVWAYGSTYSGIMPDDATMMACKDASSCEWNATRWKHEVHTDVLNALTLVDESEGTPDGAGLATVVAPQPPSSASSLSSPSSSSQTLQKRQHGYTEDRTPILSPSAAELLEKKLGLIDEKTLARAYIRFDSQHYILRPEALESVWIMYRLTGDETWREKGWKMYEAIIKNTRTPTAHSAIASVMAKHPKSEDSMQSFWLAETLKYAYLLFSEPGVISLDEYVLNTEAHPFKRPK